ncbi:immunoglobulin-like domain-containing protein [Arcobacter suis]|uniref:immunoglobulin-like domain-containing protein n=1 Tax=Arcobacter suis TaxID=1278212 RepID=UPI0034DD4209
MVTIENGKTITIEPNSSEGTSSPVAVNRKDGYKETDSITNSINGVTGGESFEKLQADTREVSTEIIDDQVQLYEALDEKKSRNENGGSLTFKAKIEDLDVKQVVAKK